MTHSLVPQTEIERARDYDLLALTERYTTLSRVAASGGGEYAGPCPLCPGGGGRDRFRVQPQRRRWLCRPSSPGIMPPRISA